MAKQTAIDEQEQTPAQGAEGGSENLQEQATGEQPQSELLVSETPEWVAEILASNQAVIESNQAVIDSVAEFKEAAVDLINGGKASQGLTVSQLSEDKFDESADYEVVEGKSFRDPKDFNKEYTEGDDVTHLGEEVLKRLLAQGLIEEA